VKNIKFIDLFAGIGGFHLVLKKLGAECVFASEWDKHAQDIYFRNHKIRPNGDITKINEKEIPDHDILCAGFPCQAFSISGKQKGFEDARGTLFFDILRIVREKKPRVIFLENVANLKKHDKGRTFSFMKKLLQDEGYKVDEKVLNAKDFGLAQSRERIVIVASKNGFDFSKVKNKKEVKIKDILENNTNEILSKDEYTILPKHLWKKQPSGLIFCGYRNKAMRTKGVREDSQHLSRSHKQPNRIYHVDGTHPTLSSQESSGRYFVYDGKNVRKLSLRECYRLQGFPDAFKLSESKTQAYKQIGNSVPLKMIEAIAKEILNQFFKENQNEV